MPVIEARPPSPEDPRRTESPKLFDVRSALESGMITYRPDNGYAFLRAPEMTGVKVLPISPERQVTVTGATYEGLVSTLSRTSNSPKMEDGKTLKEFVDTEYEKYGEALMEAVGRGFPVPLIGNFLYDPLGQQLLALAPEKIHRLSLATSNSLYKDPQGRSLAQIWEVFDKARVSIAGMSVGSNVMEGIVRNIGPKQLTVADLDVTDPGNIKRMNRADIRFLAEPHAMRSQMMDPFDQPRPKKVDMEASAIMRVDPYMKLRVIREGVSRANIEDFLHDSDLVVEVIDDIDYKIMIREEARKRGIAVFMPSDVDGRVFGDYYGYHEDRSLPLVHGLTDNEVFALLEKKRKSDRSAMGPVFKAFIGEEVADGPFGMYLDGVGEFATSSIPQHGATALAAGYVAARVVEDFYLGKPIPRRFVLKPY
ncbi:MAG: ThiF family adenylyltransferase [Candidatus Levyibacteriota bacterium]